MTSKATFLWSRAIEAALLLLGLAIVFAPDDNTNLYVFAWDFVALIYLTIRIIRLKRSKRADRTEWLARGLGGRFGLIFTIFTSLVGIGAGLDIVVTDGDDKWLAKAVGVPCVLLAWAILHFGYAERYAKKFYDAGPAERPLAFPNIENPGYIEFVYFSFTLGTTFSVSDVETQTSAIRGQVLSHSILSFIYNTATIGIAVSVITG